ncbi:MAG TPA: hypothetical protein VD763_03610 [Candidatus Saccharimonadales bacterium]|nr:hypothetical protein [Candidatus Saccharimonadales bacterium]
MTVTRWLAVAGLVLALAGIATYQVVRPRSTWVDPATHVVDGYWVGPEAGCDTGASEPTCRVAVETAIAHVADTEPSLATDRATLTQRAGMFYDRTGERAGILQTTGGFRHPVLVIVELSDGGRRLVGLTCGFEPAPGPRSPVCDVADVGADRVGHEPWLTHPPIDG